MPQCQECKRYYLPREMAIGGYGIDLCWWCVEDNAAPDLVREYERRRAQDVGQRRRPWPQIGSPYPRLMED